MGDTELDTMMKTLLTAVDTLSNSLGSITSEAADADPEITPMLRNLQTMMKYNITNLKKMMIDIKNPDAVSMAGTPAIVNNQRSFRNTDNDGTLSADQIMSRHY